MAITPVSIPSTGPEWRIDGIPSETAPASGVGPAAAPSRSFGSFLADQVQGLEATQTDAARKGAEVAAGTSEDPTAAVMAIERARLSMQLASQIRTKGVEAVQEVFRTTV